MRSCPHPLAVAVAVVLASVIAAWESPALADAQLNAPVTGDAALRHPVGQLALRAAELVTAGKLDEAMALRTRSEQSSWRGASAIERSESGGMIRRQTPDPKVLSAAIQQGGELSIMGNSAVLSATVAKGRAVTYFEREGATWRIANGPMVFEDVPAPVNETRVENGDILIHPIGSLMLQYLDLIHASKIEDAKKLATSAVQAKWRGEPAREKVESLAFLRKNLPTRAVATTGLQGGKNLRGVLIIEDGRTATLNLIASEQRADGPGKTIYSSTTTAIAFAMEGGQWKLDQ